VGRLHRLHDNKRFVQVYDYVDNYVQTCKQPIGYRAIERYSAAAFHFDREEFLANHGDYALFLDEGKQIVPEVRGFDRCHCCPTILPSPGGRRAVVRIEIWMELRTSGATYRQSCKPVTASI
jgi:hypothetical protein